MEPLRDQFLTADNLSVHVVEGGRAGQPAMVFLHGWPQDWSVFERMMVTLAGEAHVVAIDLPGIGRSSEPSPANDKRTLAKLVRNMIRQLELEEPTLVGHDVGGMIAYAYLRAWPDEIARAVIMNTAIPGVQPWDDVKRNGCAWHFAFHAVPELPEKLVANHVPDYFAYFYDTLSATPHGVMEQARQRYAEAYARPSALQTGFEWYRAFRQDERDNLAARGRSVRTPVLYLRGDKDRGLELERYIHGCKASGLQNVRGALIADCGHFAADERPDEVVEELRRFTQQTTAHAARA